MRTYGQYCPLARAAEVLAERWTLVIVRNLLLGHTTYTVLAEGAPGIPRSLLTSRLRQLERVGIVTRSVAPGGRTTGYGLTDAGKDLADVVAVLGSWGERWLELAPEHLDPGMVLWSWCNNYLVADRLPERRVVVRFEFPGQPGRGRRYWFVLDGGRCEFCRTDPGFDEDLVVETDARTLVEWHLGRVEWQDAVRAGRISVHGPGGLARQLPTWNRRSAYAALHRA